MFTEICRSYRQKNTPILLNTGHCYGKLCSRFKCWTSLPIYVLIYLFIYPPIYLYANLKMSRDREVTKDIAICFNDSLPQCWKISLWGMHYGFNVKFSSFKSLMASWLPSWGVQIIWCTSFNWHLPAVWLHQSSAPPLIPRLLDLNPSLNHL